MGDIIQTRKQGLSRKLAGSFRDSVEFRKIVCNICDLWYFIYMFMNKILFVWHGNTTDNRELAALVGQNWANRGIWNSGVLRFYYE